MNLVRRIAFHGGWALMGLPVGINRVNKTLMRYGPYRWGAALHDWGSR